MIFDSHAHVVPDQSGDAGYSSADEYADIQQRKVKQFWGRMTSSHSDIAFAPEPGESVNFRAGRYGRWEWVKLGEDCWMQRFPTIMARPEWTAEQMLAAMDEIGVDMALLQSGTYLANDYGAELFRDVTTRHPSRFVGSVSVAFDPAAAPAAQAAELDKLSAAAEDWGCRAVVQGFDPKYDFDDARLDPFWRRLADLNLPHIYFTGFVDKVRYEAQLVQIRNVATRFPDTKHVISHTGGNIRHPSDPNHTAEPETIIELLRAPNVYFEVGYFLAYERRDLWGADSEFPYSVDTQLVEDVYHAVGAERLIWASDMPNTYRACTYRQSLDVVKHHYGFMSDVELAGVLGGNAADLFRANGSER